MQYGIKYKSITSFYFASTNKQNNPTIYYNQPIALNSKFIIEEISHYLFAN